MDGSGGLGEGDRGLVYGHLAHNGALWGVYRGLVSDTSPRRDKRRQITEA